MVLKDLFQIIRTAGSDLEIADDRGPVAGTECESERRDGVEGLEDVRVAVKDGGGEGGMKVVLLDDAPGNKLLRLAVTVFPEEPLRKAVFNFAGVGKSAIGVEMDEVSETIDSCDVAISKRGFDGVLVPATSLVLLQGSAVEESFERRRAELDGELAGVAGDGSGAKQASGIEGFAVPGGAESGGSRHAEPLAKVQRNGNARRQFVTSHEIGSLNILIAAECGAGAGVETGIDGGPGPGRLLDGPAACLRP